MNNWASNYVDQVNAKEEKALLRKKEQIIKELNAVRKQLRRKNYWKEAEFIEKKMIPYVERMAFLPPSYLSMIDGYGELLKFGKRVNRRIW